MFTLICVNTALTWHSIPNILYGLTTFKKKCCGFLKSDTPLEGLVFQRHMSALPGAENKS